MTVLSAKEIQALTAAADLSDLPVKYRKIIAGFLENSGTQSLDVDLFVDGAADLHSQTARIGGAVFVEGKEIYCYSEPQLNKTNNEAEYIALLNGEKTWSINHIRREKNKLTVGLIKQSMAQAKAAK